MLTQEEINNEVQIRLAVHEEKFNSVMTKIDSLADELRDFKQEMRGQNAMRANEVAEIRKSVQDIQASGRNQTIVTFLGIAAMVIAVLLK